jgi:hypothetical protein
MQIMLVFYLQFNLVDPEQVNSLFYFIFWLNMNYLRNKYSMCFLIFCLLLFVATIQHTFSHKSLAPISFFLRKRFVQIFSAPTQPLLSRLRLCPSGFLADLICGNCCSVSSALGFARGSMAATVVLTVAAWQHSSATGASKQIGQKPWQGQGQH